MQNGVYEQNLRELCFRLRRNLVTLHRDEEEQKPRKTP